MRSAENEDLRVRRSREELHLDVVASGISVAGGREDEGEYNPKERELSSSCCRAASGIELAQ